ncbi:calcium-activated chloride channel regulator 3A-1-like [Varroa jacobsoni]|uniref:calcium-activated chloride channel regulator 3A-1-like n=1 Tax=Varroa jacobsoni TaxID=62625 RepID=UPI000BF49A63|nr:calcium-activated chloride channel regulator 3A-1-like [Varroa jacobsoni]
MRQPRHGPAAVSRNRTPLGKRYTLEIFPSCFRFDRRAIVRLTVVLLLIVLCCWPTEVVNGSRVQVDPQIKAYEGLVVAISPKIKQNHGKSIISNLEAVLRNASGELHRARGVYIHEVFIIVPRSWGSRGTWAPQKPPKVKAPSWQQWNRADILIERGEESVFGEIPFVVQYGGCGVQGRHLVVPDTFLRTYAANSDQSPNRFDKYGKPHHVLLREWAVYRYGVFKEHGFPRDPVYPLYLPKPGSQDPNEIELNVCANGPVKPQFRNGNGVACNATINLMNGFPLDQDCIPVYSAGHEAVEASLMSGLPSATHFCGGPNRAHDRTLPTKHNVMCDEKSTTEVIERHPDFYGKARDGYNHLGRTTFIFLQERAQVVAFVIQISETTMQHNHRNYILRALNQFLRSEAPSEMQIALVTYGAVTSEIALRRASASDDSVRNAVDALLLNADIESGSHANSTLEDGLRAALEALNDTSEIMERLPLEGFTKRVLVIGDGHLSRNFDELIHHNYKLQSIRVDSIIFPSRGHVTFPTSTASASVMYTDAAHVGNVIGNNHLPVGRPSLKTDNTLDTFVAQTGGRTVAIDDTPIDNAVTVTALQQLYDALYSFTFDDTSSPQSDSYNQIEQKEFYGKEQHDMVFEFDIDPTLSSELRIRLLGHDYGSDRTWTVLPKDISLFAPDGHSSGKKVYSPKDYKYVSTNSQFWYYEFRIPEPAVGRWRLEAKARKDTKQPIVVSAAAKPSEGDDEPITVDVWISQPSHNVSLQERGLIVYAKVSKGSRPVVDAKVIAKITPVSDQSETQLCIDLRDNGAGDPDVTKDDGVYSRYVEGIKNLGRHRLVVEAKSEGNAAVLRGATVPDDTVPHTACCGSLVVRTALNTTRPFARRVHFGSIFITRVLREQRDGEIRTAWAVPGRVTDLHVVYLQSNPQGVSLGWTATGNVKDHGRAASYILKRFDNRDEAVSQFDERGQVISHWEMDGNPPVPKEAGSREQVFVKVASGSPLPQYFTLKVNNTYGALSAVSNIVTVSVMPPITTTISSIWGISTSGSGQGNSGAPGGTTSGNFDLNSDHILPGQREGPRLLPGQLALIIAIPLVILMLGVCILIIIVARRRKDPLLVKAKKAPVNDKNNGGSLGTPNNGTLPKEPLHGDNVTPVLTPSPVLKEGLSPMATMAPGLPLNPSMGLDHMPMSMDHSISMNDQMNMSMTMNMNLNQMGQQQAGLSPVNHWPAEVLLEHYNKVQEAKQRQEPPPVLTLQAGHHDESINSSNPSIYSTMDPFRNRPQINPSMNSQLNTSIQHSANLNSGIYSPYYGNPPIVTPMGLHVSTRNITQV